MAGKNQLIDQCRKPAGWLGRFLLWVWNIRHSRVTDWGLRHVAIAQRDTILDVGCGGGRTVRKLAGVATQGRVCGVDHSEESVAAARRTNRHGIATGRVEIRLGSVSDLPFPTGTFDLVTAVETHFWWPLTENGWQGGPPMMTSAPAGSSLSTRSTAWWHSAFRLAR